MPFSYQLFTLIAILLIILATPPPVPLEIQKGLEQIYEGIKKNAELNAQRAKSDPEFAKQQEARAQADYYGHYVPSK